MARGTMRGPSAVLAAREQLALLHRQRLELRFPSRLIIGLLCDSNYDVD